MSLVPIGPQQMGPIALGRARPPPQLANQSVIPSLPPAPSLSREIAALANQTFVSASKSALWLTPDNLFSFFLRSMEIISAWSVHPSPSDDLLDQVKLIRQILRLMHAKLNLTVDEATVNLSVERLYLLPVGKPKALQSEIIEALTSVIEVIDTDPTISQLSDFQFLRTKVGGLKRPTGLPPFSRQLYREKVKEPLIDQVARRLGVSKDPDVRAWMEKAVQQPETFELVKAYLRGESGQAEEFWEEIGNEKIKAVLNHLQMAFVQVLPQVFEKQLFIDYGALTPEEYKALPKEMQELVDPHIAMPWLGADAPDVGSRFHLSLAEAFYTLMHHRNQGIPLDSIRHETTKMKAQVLEALKTPGVVLEEISAYRDFKKMCGSQQQLNLFDLRESDLLLLQQSINSNKEQL